eukprot:1157593-Pelagomonas_calceolata.AAC.8
MPPNLLLRWASPGMPGRAWAREPVLLLLGRGPAGPRGREGGMRGRRAWYFLLGAWALRHLGACHWTEGALLHSRS